MDFKKVIFLYLFSLNMTKKINFKQYAILNAYLIKKVLTKKNFKKINIKWPNDLLFNHQKFCGILQELIKFNRYYYLVVGIGLNTNIAPKTKALNQLA